MIASKGKIGRDGVMWFERLRDECTSNPQMISEWQGQFLDSIAARIEYYGEDTFWSEKQVNILIAIAERVGVL